MFNPDLKYILALFIVFFSLHNVSCIKCFECQSTIDPKCADPFDNSTVPIINCDRVAGLTNFPDARPTMCRKIKQKVNDEWRYIRECAHLEKIGNQGDDRFCFTRTGANNIYMEYCTCNSKDGCNSSADFSPMPLLIICLIARVIYKAYM